MKLLVVFLAGGIAGLYAGAWLVRPSFPDPCTETATDGRIWRWQPTSPAT